MISGNFNTLEYLIESMANNKSQMDTSRRTLLKTVSTGSITWGMSSIVGAASEPTKTIVVERRQGDPATTEEVPKRWWNHVEVVKRKRTQFRSEYQRDNAILGIGIGFGRDEIAGRTKRTLIFQLKSGRTPDETIPTEVKNIAVTRKEYDPDETEYDSCNPTDYCDTQTYESIPGGSNIRHNDSNQGFSAMAKAILDNSNYDDKEAIVTCLHPYIDGDYCEDPVVWGSTYSGWQMEWIGDTWDGAVQDRHQDIALVPVDSTQVNAIPKVKNSYNDSIPVSGVTTKDGIINRIGDEVIRYGARNCKETGTIDSLGESIAACSGGSTADWVFIDDICRGGGDSGAPYYLTWSSSRCAEHARLVSIHRGSPGGTPDDVAHGCAAYEMEDSYPFWFDTELQCLY